MGVELPLIVSGTITDRSGRTLSGQTPEAFYFSMRHLKPFAVGLNCALGAELMRPYLAEIAAVADTLVIAYPNAGLPNAMGEYDEGPHDMACQLGPWAQGRAAQHRRRLLRLHARAHRGDQGARRQSTRRASRPSSSARCASRASSRSCMGERDGGWSALREPSAPPPPRGGRMERHGLSVPIASRSLGENRLAKSDGVPGGGDGDTRATTPPPDAPYELAPQGSHVDQSAQVSGANSWRAFLPLKGEGSPSCARSACNDDKRKRGDGVHQYRRADQRHGVGEVSQADRGRTTTRRRWRWRARQVENGAQILDVNMDEGLLDSEKAMVTFLNLIAAEPDIARVPVMIDSLEVVGDRGGPQVRAGQGHRQLHQHEGGRGGLPRARQQGAALRRRRGGDGVRRAGPGRHHRAQGRDLRAGLQAADREGGLPARGHHLRSQHLRRRHRHRGAQRLRHRLHRGDAPDQGRSCRTCTVSGGVSNLSFSFRGNEARAPGHALGVPLPRHRRRPRHGDRQRRADHASTTTSSRSCASCART